MTMMMTMANITNTTTTLYYPGYSPDLIILYSFIAFKLIVLLSTNSKINSLMFYDDYTYHKRDFEIFNPGGQGLPDQLLDLSNTFYNNSTVLLNNNFFYQLSSIEVTKLFSCFKELNSKLDIVSYTIEKVLYIPPPEDIATDWSDWEPIYRKSYILLRQSINNVEELINYLVSSGNFDPLILGM